MSGHQSANQPAAESEEAVLNAFAARFIGTIGPVGPDSDYDVKHEEHQEYIFSSRKLAEPGMAGIWIKHLNYLSNPLMNLSQIKLPF